jgi:hypothetical protein
MINEAPPNRRRFVSIWDEIVYLYHKLLYWLYERQDRRRALPFADRLQRLLDKAPDSREAILGAECRALISELKGDLRRAIAHRENEVNRIKRLHEISRDLPNRDFVLKGYDYGALSDRLDLLAVLYHDNGELDRAIRTLEESRELCDANRIPFDGKDLLEDYRHEKEESGQRDESKAPRRSHAHSRSCCRN